MSGGRLMAQPKKENTVETIIAHYLDERSIKLTPVQDEQRQRCEAAFTMLIWGHSITQVVKKLQSLYKIKKSAAYRTLADAELIFGSVKKFNKDAWRFIQIERKRRHIHKCELEGRMDLVVKLEEQIDKLIGFDRDDLAFDPEKLKAQNYDLKISEALQNALVNMINKGPVDLNNLEAEEIPYEPVQDKA